MGSMIKKAYGVFLLLLICITLQTSASAQSAFVLEDPLRFNYPIVGASVSFLVFSKQGTISHVSVRVRNIKDGDGQPLATDAVTACFVSGEICLPPDQVQVTEEGISVTLKLNSTFFKKAGEYHAVILFEGMDADQKPIKAPASPVIVRPAAEINLDELKDQTIELYRWFPWGTAERTFQIYLRETSGKSELRDVQVLGQAIYVKETKILAPGLVEAAPANQNPQTNSAENSQQAAAEMARTPNQIKLNLHLKDLEWAGSFETRLVVESPGLAAPKPIPLRLTVSDIVFWPLLVIFLGVVGGFLTNYFSGRWRTGQLNQRTILQLQSELGRFRRLVKSTENAAKIEAMWRRLRSAEDSNELGDNAKVKTDLDQIEKDLADFRKAQVESKAKILSDLNVLQNQIKGYRQQFNPVEPDEERNLHSIDDRLLDVQRLLRQDEVDYAAEKIESTNVLFTDLRKSRLTKYLGELENHFNELVAVTGAPDQAASKLLMAEAKMLLVQGKLDDAGTKLEELKVAIQTLSGKSTQLAARGMPPLRLASPPVLQALPVRTRINIRTALEDRTTEKTIEFEIIDSEGLLQGGEQFRWNFGEAGSQREDGAVISYTYREFGDYEVRVEILRNSESIRELAEPLTVLPDRLAARSRKILENIQLSDVFLSAIALLLASLTGILFLYVGKPFGTLSDYILALLWGFGIDNSVRGFSAVMGKVRSSGGAE